ncbi:hypothetical protein GE21DRAFT_1328662 [Neurospora crassa]|nr:hypothetical protein GE21DRAFT_1328662 [Neurospora crassa]
MLLMAIDFGTGSGLCKPGGWIEHVDITATEGCEDGTVVTGSALEQYGKLFSGNNFSSGRRLRKGWVCALEGTGIRIFPWPQDPKQKDVGLYAYAEVSSDFQSIIQFTFG